MNRSLILAQQQLYLSYLPHVRRQFGSLPGVEVIGLGAKEKKGTLLEEWAFRFYVRKKLPFNEIPLDERIPDTIFGIQTDVITHFEKETLVCNAALLSVDNAGYRDNGLRGGIGIRNEHFDNDQISGYGTLGILARRKSDNKLVGLSCAHVVNAASGSVTDINTKIGQPKYWISCCCCPHGYIGDVAKATSTSDLDCAIITIHDDLLDKITNHTTENQVEGIGLISGAAAIMCFDTVRKRGRATGLTTGKISDMAYGTNQMLIERTDGNAGDPFACHGDSGAVIVNSSNQVVGLLVAASRGNMSRIIATHIKPVMADLGITIAGTDVASIGEPVGGGPGGCELHAWPGGHTDTALNPVEIFESSDFGFTGAVNWDVSGGAPGAVILGTGTQTAIGQSTITVRYDRTSASKNPTDTVWIKAIHGSEETTKFRTIFTINPRFVNTSSLILSNNTNNFAATGGNNNRQAGVAVPGTDGATWFLAKAEIVYDISPSDLSWSGSGGISFVTGAPAGTEGNIVSRRESKFTRGEQAAGATNRTHTDQTGWASAGDSTADDFQAPTDAAPNEAFRLANEGFDPSNLIQGYLRADYRDYLEFFNGLLWERITPYSEWFANLTADRNAAGTVPPVAGAVNTIGTGANSEKIPNQKPAITVSPDQEVRPGELVTLTATPADPDQDVLTPAAWIQTAGPAVALSSATGNSVTFTAPANDPQLKFSATTKDATELLSRTLGNHLSDPAVATVNVVEWLHRDGGSATLAENETELFTAADFGIGAGLLNWNVTTGGTSAVIIEADGAAVAPTGTVNGANTIRVRYDNASGDTTRAQTVKIQASNPSNGKSWFKRRTVRVVEWLQRCGGKPVLAENETEVFTSAQLGLAGSVDWSVDTGATNAFIVETGGATAAGRASITVRFDHHSADGTRANTVVIRATDPGNADNFFYKRRSVMRITLTLRNTGTIEPSPENEDYASCTAAAGGTDVLGPLPMGTGRADAVGEAYTSPLQVIAEVVGHMPTTVFRWKRFITRRSWFIQQGVFSSDWEVTQRTRRGFPDDDTGAVAFNDSTPSPALNRMYIYDNSALALGPLGGAATNGLSVGAFVYEEKDFTYQMQRQDGVAFHTCAEIRVGQRIIARRDDDTGTVSTDWAGIENSTAIRTLSATVTEAEVRAIVGGTDTINIDANANN